MVLYFGMQTNRQMCSANPQRRPALSLPAMAASRSTRRGGRLPLPGDRRATSEGHRGGRQEREEVARGQGVAGRQGGDVLAEMGSRSGGQPLDPVCIVPNFCG
jgi:hypothetical protein